MVIPELRSLHSADLERPALPPACEDCSVYFQASIGPNGVQGSEVFGFAVVTPAFLSRMELPRWGHGLFVVQAFSWLQVDRSLERLLAQAHRATWPEVATALRQQMEWEFESYQPRR